ncbi:MAG: hypothetical protein P4M10_03565 [Verrucomicrobiae bacterium]|jgi:hypothetical protein|nr:hypothetical protein [Verrucomicrobiae bacterium]
MKTLLLILLLPASGFCQQYAIGWYKIAGGGGTSANGSYAISGTIGQPDAGGPLAGGNYSLRGGFWSLIGAMQSVGAPNLTIIATGPNSVKVLWPDTGSYILQQNTSLATGNWTASSYPITTANGMNSITITSPAGSLFFRLEE